MEADPELPPCVLCGDRVEVVTAFASLGKRSRVYISECTNCGHHDMYEMLHGIVHRL